jgi:predicted amidophosphoribosyltransferase
MSSVPDTLSGGSMAGMEWSLLETLFPRRCVGCGRGDWPFCEACRGRATMLGPPGCDRCGRPLEEEVDGCADCPPPGVAWCRAPFLYAGPVRTGLLRLKFRGLRSHVDAFAPAMVDQLEMVREGTAYRPRGGGPSPPAGWTLTWVPLGARRLRVRGFDQAQALAQAIGSLTGLPVRSLLQRVRDTDPQARRSGPDRRRALSDAFRARPHPFPHVLLVDDVLTSGATAAACARAVQAAGAREVGLLTAARSLGGPLPARCYNPAVLPPGSVVARERSSR